MGTTMTPPPPAPDTPNIRSSSGETSSGTIIDTSSGTVEEVDTETETEISITDDTKSGSTDVDTAIDTSLQEIDKLL
jgi:hypothetical protein